MLTDVLAVRIRIRGTWQVGAIDRVQPPPTHPMEGEPVEATLHWFAWLKGRPPNTDLGEPWPGTPAATPLSEIQDLELWTPTT